MKIYPYGSNFPIKLVGSFTANIKYKGDTKAAELYVTASAGECLLSYSMATSLGIIEAYFNALTKESIRKQFHKFFSGIGKLKNYKLKFEVDPAI